MHPRLWPVALLAHSLAPAELPPSQVLPDVEKVRGGERREEGKRKRIEKVSRSMAAHHPASLIVLGGVKCVCARMFACVGTQGCW